MPTTNVRRLFGIIDDATVGGKSYDDLSTTTADANGYTVAVPDATTFWPATGGTIARNLQRIDRASEVRLQRPNVPPLPFMAQPVATIPFGAYPSIVAKLLKKALGGADTVTGTTATGYTHTIASLSGIGQVLLPALHLQLVRDDLNEKMAGGSVERLSLDFPLSGEGTAEAEIHGLYHKYDPASVPAASYAAFDTDVWALRDSRIFIDGSTTAVSDLIGFSWEWINNTVPKWFGFQNIESRVNMGTNVGGNDLRRYRKIWWPEQNRIQGAQSVNWGLMFGSVNAAQEIAADFGQIEQLVFETYGAPVSGSSPSVNEMLRITLYNVSLNDGGADALASEGDLTSNFQGGAFYSDAAAADMKIEYLNGSSAALT